MNDALAHERLSGILELIDRWGDLYLRRWGKRGNPESPGLAAEVDKGIDEVRARTKLAHDVIAAVGDIRPAPHLHFEIRTNQPDIPGPAAANPRLARSPRGWVGTPRGPESPPHAP